jgi:cellulose biosynthesis protein BcsQ
MISYSFWNNKGGVGKSFLCFASAALYAKDHPYEDVYVIDLCPQANLSEALLGGQGAGGKNLTKLLSRSPRSSVAGYLEARLSSPFAMINEIEDYLTQPSHYNGKIPTNLYLVSGDNLVEVLSDAIRQTSQLMLPNDSWARVIHWVRDLTIALENRSATRPSKCFIDCNPSFSIYTQQALAASTHLVVPFTPDDSSRRGLENIVALLYGIGDPSLSPYLNLSFARKTKEQNVELPKLFAFVNNRVTFYEGKPSKAFAAASKAIKNTVDAVYGKNKRIFAAPGTPPSELFTDIPDNHSANVVCALEGTPLHALKAGPHVVHGERIQVNQGPLEKYKAALKGFVEHL